jgi:hypothetical protein
MLLLVQRDRCFFKDPFQKSAINFWTFFILKGIKKVYFIACEHRLQLDNRQTCQKSEDNRRLPLFTIPIDIGENTFTTLNGHEHRGSVQQSVEQTA